MSANILFLCKIFHNYNQSTIIFHQTNCLQKLEKQELERNSTFLFWSLNIDLFTNIWSSFAFCLLCVRRWTINDIGYVTMILRLFSYFVIIWCENKVDYFLSKFCQITTAPETGETELFKKIFRENEVNYFFSKFCQIATAMNTIEMLPF